MYRCVAIPHPNSWVLDLFFLHSHLIYYQPCAGPDVTSSVFLTQIQAMSSLQAIRLSTSLTSHPSIHAALTYIHTFLRKAITYHPFGVTSQAKLPVQSLRNMSRGPRNKWTLAPPFLSYQAKILLTNQVRLLAPIYRSPLVNETCT